MFLIIGKKLQFKDIMTTLTKGAKTAHMAPVNKLKKIICFGEFAFCSMRLILNVFK